MDNNTRINPRNRNILHNTKKQKCKTIIHIINHMFNVLNISLVTMQKLKKKRFNKIIELILNKKRKKMKDLH